MSVAVNCRVKDTKMKPFSCKACIFCICKHTNTIKTRRQMNEALHEYIFSVDCIIKGDFIHMEMFGRAYKTNKKVSYCIYHVSLVRSVSMLGDDGWRAGCTVYLPRPDATVYFHHFSWSVNLKHQLASYSCKCELQVLHQLQLKSHFIPC